MGSAYTWSGADGGSWVAASNWVDNLGTTATQAPGSADLAQFVIFSGTVTGALGADVLYVSGGSDLTLGGSGYFSSINIGTDLVGDTGAATLAIDSGEVVSASMLDIGTAIGGSGTLVANGTFVTAGGIAMDLSAVSDAIIVYDSGQVLDGANLNMLDGGLIQVAPSGQMVIGPSSTDTGINGALLIASGYIFAGEGTIAANVVVNGSLETDNGGYPINTLSVTGNVSGTGTIIAVQELDIGGAIGSGVMVGLFGNGGTNAGLLRLANPAADLGTLNVMSVNSTIALTGETFDSAAWTTGSLTMTGASGTLTLATQGDFSHLRFVTQPDAISGTDVLVLSAACFTEGTRIATARGEVAVEALRIGDMVVTASGRLAPVVWLGHRNVDCARHPCPWDVLPVRVAPGAFGPGQPSRPLLLSPDHAVYAGGALIPIRYLENGASVRQLAAESVTYWHVELPSHDVLLAEGLPAESYLDTGNRAAFTDEEATQIDPDFALARWENAACATLVAEGPVLETARRALLARLPAAGFALSEDAALRFTTETGAPVAARQEGAWLRLTLPPGTAWLRIASRHAAPAAFSPQSADWRPLGVALAGLRLDGEAVALGDPRLCHGWFGPEPGLRWTDGAGELDVRGAAVVELHPAPLPMRYPVAA